MSITLSVQMFDSDGNDIAVDVPACWVICDQCRGKGTSSAYLGAFTHADMQEEGPEFVEDYMTGAYDRACDLCNGSGKLLEPDHERIEAGDSDEQKAAIAYLDRKAGEDAEDARTRRFEDGDYSY